MWQHYDEPCAKFFLHLRIYCILQSSFCQSLLKLSFNFLLHKLSYRASTVVSLIQVLVLSYFNVYMEH